jgi:hypothetical protein
MDIVKSESINIFLNLSQFIKKILRQKNISISLTKLNIFVKFAHIVLLELVTKS